MGHDRGEDHHHAHQGRGCRPAEADLELGPQHVELAHEQAERRESEECHQPEREDAHRVRGDG